MTGITSYWKKILGRLRRWIYSRLTDYHRCLSGSISPEFPVKPQLPQLPVKHRLSFVFNPSELGGRWLRQGNCVYGSASPPATAMAGELTPRNPISIPIIKLIPILLAHGGVSSLRFTPVDWYSCIIVHIQHKSTKYLYIIYVWDYI